MSHLTCPNCYHHSFEVKPVGGSTAYKLLERVLIFIGFNPSWFNNIIMRCKTCKYYWKA